MKPFWLVGTVADFVIFNLSFALCVYLEPWQVSSRCLTCLTQNLEVKGGLTRRVLLYFPRGGNGTELSAS